MEYINIKPITETKIESKKIPEKIIPNKYLRGYLPIKIKVKIIKKIIAAVEKFEGKINKITIDIGIQSGKIDFTNFISFP